MNSKNYWLRLASGLGVFAVLIGLWYGDEYYTEIEEKEKEESRKALVFEADKVLSLEIQAGADPVEIARENAQSDWLMAAPYEGIKADQDAVRSFVTTLGELRRERELPPVEGEKVADFGLDAPKRVVVLGLEGGQELKLEVGGDVQIGKQQGSSFKALSVYGRVSGGEGLIVMPSSVLTSTDKAFKDFRTKEITNFGREAVAFFSYESTGGVVEASKSEDGSWKVSLAGAKAYAGDANAIGLYLDKLQRLKADRVTERSEFKNGRLSTLGLEPPSRTITVNNAQGELLQSLPLGVNSTQTSAIMADGGVATLSLESYAELTPELKTLRDLRVMAGFDFTKLKRFNTEGGKIFEKEGQKWYRVAGGGSSEPPSRESQESRSEVATLTSDFEFMRAKDVIDPEDVGADATYGLDKPIASLTFEFEEGYTPAKVVVTLGSRVDGDETSIYLKHSESAAVFITETSWMDTLEALDADPDDKAEEGGLSPQAKKDDQDSK